LEPTLLTPEVWFDQKDEEVLISMYFLEFKFTTTQKKLMDLDFIFQLIHGVIKFKYWKAL
jgi:hypothetical protein